MVWRSFEESGKCLASRSLEQEDLLEIASLLKVTETVFRTSPSISNLEMRGQSGGRRSHSYYNSGSHVAE